MESIAEQRNRLMDAPLKVLHIITRLDMGGSAQNTLSTCIEHDHNRYRVFLIHGPSEESAMTPEEKQEVAAGIARAKARGVEVSIEPCLVRRIDPVMDARAFIGIVSAIRRIRPDIVHTHTSKAGMIGRLAAFVCMVPVVIHTPHGHVFTGHFPPITSRIFLLAERAASLFTDAMIALTMGEKNDYVELRLFPANRIEVIPSGIDVGRFSVQHKTAASMRRRLGLMTDAPLIGFFGWLEPVKDPVTMIEAMPIVWKSFPDATLLFVGKGSLLSKLEAMAREMDAKGRIRFLGWRRDVEKIYQAIDLLCLTSKNEGMGRVIAEAMASGKPVVATRVGGVTDLVVDGKTGILVDSMKPAAIAAAVIQILSDPALAHAMGRQGRMHVRVFDKKQMVYRIERLYRRMAKSQGLKDLGISEYAGGA